MSAGVPRLRDALATARRYGCEVRPVRRTGEVLVIAPDGSRVRANNRRDDAPLVLVQMLRRLAAGRPAPASAFMSPRKEKP